MMHTVSTGAATDFANVYDDCAQSGGSASGHLLTSSPDIPCLQTGRLFVLLANVQEL